MIPQSASIMAIDKVTGRGIVLLTDRGSLAWGGLQMSEDILQAICPYQWNTLNALSMLANPMVVDPLTFRFDVLRREPESAVFRAANPWNTSRRITVRIDGDRLELVENMRLPGD